MARTRLDDRLHDFRDAIDRLREAVAAWGGGEKLLYRDAMIQRFEFTFELAWKTTQDWLRIWEADVASGGPRQIIAAAVARGVITDGNAWTQMLDDRNLTSRIDDSKKIAPLAERIMATSVNAFDRLIERLSHDS